MAKTNQVENPAYIVMQSYTEKIVSSGLDPMEIASKLFSSKTSWPILGENDYDTITSRLTRQSGRERLQSLVRIVCIAVERDQDNEVFPTFLQVLRNVGSITSCKLAENLHTALINEGLIILNIFILTTLLERIVFICSSYLYDTGSAYSNMKLIKVDI